MGGNGGELGSHHIPGWEMQEQLLEWEENGAEWEENGRKFGRNTQHTRQNTHCSQPHFPKAKHLPHNPPFQHHAPALTDRKMGNVSTPRRSPRRVRRVALGLAEPAFPWPQHWDGA